MPPRNLREKTADLLRQTRQLEEQLEVFRRSAEGVVKPLYKIVPDAEVEAMVSPRANLLGTLENLLNQDLGEVHRQLTELARHLEGDSLPIWRAAP